jgi:hypothetical protein
VSFFRTIKCANCGSAVAYDANTPEDDRTPCPHCGSRARKIDASITETLQVDDAYHAHVVRLSETVSATAVSITTTMLPPEIMDDLWEKSGPSRESLLKDYSSDAELHVIADGLLEFAPGYTGDAYTKFLVRWNANWILLDRSRAAERQRREEDNQRADRRSLRGHIISFFETLIAWLK